MVDVTSFGDFRVEDHMPSVYTAADRASLRGQSRFKSATVWALSMLVVAAACGLVEELWAGWASGVAFALSLLATGLFVFREAETAWYDGRAVAESAKTLTWKYAVGGDPYAIAARGSEAAYRMALAAVVNEIGRLPGAVPVPSEPTRTEMLAELRTAPLPTRRAIYREQRLQEQRDWYRRRAGEHRSTATIWQIVALVLQAIGLLCAVLKGLGVIELDLLSLFAAAGAAAVAWLASNDFVKTARAYGLTTLELDEALRLVGRIDDEREWAAFVADAEQTMSREHTAWLARRRGAH